MESKPYGPTESARNIGGIAACVNIYFTNHLKNQKRAVTVAFSQRVGLCWCGVMAYGSSVLFYAQGGL